MLATRRMCVCDGVRPAAGAGDAGRNHPAGKGFDRADIYKLKLDGSGAMERLTYFADVPTYRAFKAGQDVPSVRLE